jgi:hypothetical protein
MRRDVSTAFPSFPISLLGQHQIHSILSNEVTNHIQNIAIIPLLTSQNMFDSRGMLARAPITVSLMTHTTVEMH